MSVFCWLPVKDVKQPTFPMAAKGVDVSLIYAEKFQVEKRVSADIRWNSLPGGIMSTMDGPNYNISS